MHEPADGPTTGPRDPRAPSSEAEGSGHAPTQEGVAGAGFTVDALLRGRIFLVQPRRGFRASLNPVLLSGFLAPPYGRFLDIGCGTGAVSFLLLARDPAAHGAGVELQPRLAYCTAEGARRNAWGDRFALHEGDVVAWARSQPPATFDLVATNPPFRRDSPRSPNLEKAQAHHEVSLTLADWVSLAARLVKPTGRIAAVFEASRAADLEASLSLHGLHLTRRRLVHPRPEEPPSRILIEARRLPSPLTTEPPLIVHTAQNTFTPEVTRWLGDP